MSKEHKVILMRHAKSDWGADYADDFDRPLSKRGRRDARRIGEWLGQQHLVHPLLLVSSAKRTRQTAKIVCQHLPTKETKLIIEDRLYACDREVILELIAEHARENISLLVIAHNPGLDQALEYLSNDPLDYTSSGKLMTTAALAMLGIPGAASPPARASASLQLLLRPKQLA